MTEFVQRLERSTKPISELIASYAARTASAAAIIDELIDTTTTGTFEQMYSQLPLNIQLHLRDTAINNFTNIDEIVHGIRERGGYAEGWIALREWTERQPWLAEAVAQGRRAALYSDELEVLRERYSEQGWAIAALRVEHMRAKTDDERAIITERIAELERAFAEINGR